MAITGRWNIKGVEGFQDLSPLYRVIDEDDEWKVVEYDGPKEIKGEIRTGPYCWRKAEDIAPEDRVFWNCPKNWVLS